MYSFKKILKTELKKLVNLYIFLPYYFNVSVHFKNLFAPWKRLVGVKKNKGFDFALWMEKISMNIVSCTIGFFMRTLLLLIFLLCLLMYMFIVFPIWLLIALFLTPFKYLFQQINSQENQKQKSKKAFLQAHLIEEKNQPEVEAWFEQYYLKQQNKKDNFSLDNLFKIPPLGRDWTYGFTPTLDDYTTDLTSPLSYKTILLDRKAEIKEIQRALAKSAEANVILVGEEGTGKSTILDGLAQKIFQGQTIPPLQNMRVLELNMEKALSENSDYEQKLNFLEQLLQEAALAKNIILIINDFYKYSSKRFIGDFNSVWEKYAQRPLIKLIAVTTPFYYEQIIYNQEKLKNLFHKVQIDEIKPEKALFILQEKAITLEMHYHLSIPYSALKQVIKRSQFYITHIPFPEKAISLLDDCCVYAKDNELKQVAPDLVDKVLSKKTHVPVGKLSKQTKIQLNNLETVLKENIYGQDLALESVTKAVKRAFIEENKTKPLASLLFLGPTGVGKTETAKQLAKVFFGKKDNLLRFDMSFYQNKENLADLIGSYENNSPGLLANSIREKPYTVLLIDEIEKAHKDLLNIFLTLLDEGYLIDGFGKKVDCKNLIFVATSNAGAKEISIWIKQAKQGQELTDLVKKLVIDKGLFTPEFLNRFDKFLVFEPLSLEIAEQISKKVIQEIKQEYKEQKDLDINATDDELKTWLTDSYNLENGAREIERIIRENIANKVASKLLT